MVFLPLLFYSFFFQILPHAKLWLAMCLLISLCALVGHFIAKKEFLKRKLGTELAWLPFLCCAVLSSVLYGSRSVALLLLYSYFVLVLFVVSAETDWIDNCLKAIVVFSLFHAICTLLFWVFPGLYPPVKHLLFAQNYMAYGYKSGLTNHYSTNAMYLSIGFVCSVCCLFVKNPRRDILAWVVPLVIGFALLLTTKRGPLIASLVGIVLAYMLAGNRHVANSLIKLVGLAIAASLGICILSSCVPSISMTLTRLVAMFSDETVGGRQALYEHALYMFEQSPIFGLGWGSYQVSFASTALGAMYASLGFTSMSAHNVYLQLLAETGVVGLVMFIVPAIATLRCSCRNAVELLTCGQCGAASAQISAAGIQVFFLVYCMSGNPLYDLQCYVPYFLACSVTFALATRSQNMSTEMGLEAIDERAASYR